MKTIKIGDNAYYYKNEVGDGLLSYAKASGSKNGISMVKKLVRRLNSKQLVDKKSVCTKCGELVKSDEDGLCYTCL